MLAITRYFLFIVFIFISLLVITPGCIFRPFSAKNNYLFFKTLEFLMKNFAGMRLHVQGREIVDQTRPSILIGNHQHNYDVLTVAAVFTNFTAVLGKFELGLIPFFGQIYTLAGNILVKRGNRKKALASMRKIEKKVVDEKLSILIFPEGHRNTGKQLLPFKKGAYYTAIRTQSPLIPFSVSQFINYENLNKFKPIDIYIKIGSPIETKGLTEKDIPQLITKSREVLEAGILEMNKNYQ